MVDVPDKVGTALLIGISKYADPELADLEAVETGVTAVGDALKHAGFDVKKPSVGGLTAARIDSLIRTVKVTAGGRLLVYWAGHGVSDDEGSYLMTADSRRADRSGAMTPAELADALHAVTGALQIVVILDCCAAGTAAVDVAYAINKDRVSRSVTEMPPATISLIAATQGAEDVSQLRFANAVVKTLRNGSPRGGWPVQDFEVTPQDFAEAANQWMQSEGRVGSHAGSVGIQAGSAFFRNPGYRLRARIMSVGGKTTIRRDGILAEVSGWARRTNSGLARVTGGMGTGKTTVLAQLASSATGTARTYWVDLAEDSRNSREYILKVLSDGARGRSLTSEAVLSGLASRGKPVTVVVDALDEVGAADRRSIIRDLLIPLAETSGVHVVVAMRHGVDDEAAAELAINAGLSVDLDHDEQVHDQIQLRCRQILTTANSPYAGRDDLAARAAAEIADRSGGVFLFAAEVAMSLASLAEPLDPEDDRFGEKLSNGINGAIADALLPDDETAGVLLRVLAPLAYTEGPGLPRTQVWITLANAVISGSPAITGDDVDAVLRDSGWFLRTDTALGRSVYRLHHLAYRDFLLKQIGVDNVTAHRRIVEALRCAPGHWADADPYVLRYLSVHAELAGRLDQLVEDEDFLVHADSRIMLPIASRTVSGRVRAGLSRYLQAGPLLHDSAPEVRAFTLESPGVGSTGNVRWKTTVTPVARTKWTTEPNPTQHRLLRVGGQEIKALASVRVDGRWMLAAAVERDESYRNLPGTGSIELWDDATAALHQVLLRREDSEVDAMTVVPMAADSLIVVAYRDGALEAWLPRGHAPAWSVDAGTALYQVFTIVLRGHPLLLETGYDGRLALRDPRSGAVVTAVYLAGFATFAVSYSLSGQDLVCVGTTSGTLSFRDAHSLAELGEQVPDEPWRASVACDVRGRLVLIGARGDGRMEVRDAGTGAVLALSRDRIANPDSVLTAVHKPGGDPFVVVGAGSDLSIWSTNPLDLQRFWHGHIDEVRTATVLTDASGTPSVATAGDDGTIRIWPTAGGYSMDGKFGHVATAQYSDVWYLPGTRPVIVAEDVVRYVVHDAGDGRELYGNSVPFVTTADLDHVNYNPTGAVSLGGTPMLLVYHDGRRQHLWSPGDGRIYAVPTGPYEPSRVRHQVVQRRGGPPVFVIGDGSGPLAVHDFAGGMVGVLPGSDGCLPISAAVVEGGVLVRSGDTVHHYDVVRGVRLGSLELQSAAREIDASRIVAATANGHQTVTAIRSSDGTAYLQAIGRDERLALPVRPSSGAGLTVCGASLLALTERNQLFLVRPVDAKIVVTIPMESLIGTVKAGADSELLVLVGGCLRLVVFPPQTGAVGIR